MTKNLMFIPYKTILITLFFTIAATTSALCNNMSTQPAVLKEPPALEIDLYVIPMIILAVILHFFLLEKTVAFNTKIEFHFFETLKRYNY